MQKFKFRLASFAAAAALATASAQAGPLSDEMDSIFNTMTNYTEPGAFETATRGVISGGSFYARNRIMNTTIATFSPPSWKAGCGGIDFFAGSFSFINADQFVQLLRAVAANAVGYAFQVALGTMCPDCLAQLGKLQDIIQKLNQYAGNSCQLAQGIVNDAADAFTDKRYNKEQNTASIKGYASDIADAVMNIGGTDYQSQVANDTESADKLYGNIVWRELHRNDAAKNLANISVSDERAIYEMLMSMTGTYIVTKPQDRGDDLGASSDVRMIQPTIHLRDLIEGEGVVEGEEIGSQISVKLLKCDTVEEDASGCTNPSTTTEEISSIAQKIQEILIGTDGSGGLVNKLQYGIMQASTEEILVAGMLPTGTAAQLRNLATSSKPAAVDYARSLAYVTAIEVIYNMLDQVTRSVSATISSSHLAEAQKVQQQLGIVRRELHDDYRVLTSQYGDFNSLSEKYQNFLRNIEAARLAWMTANSGNSR